MSRAPVGLACLCCVEANIESQRPAEKLYDVVVQDEMEKIMVAEFANRLRGKHSLFFKEAINADLLYQATWEDSYQPVPLSRCQVRIQMPTM